MKVFTACISTETNTFSPIDIGLKDYEEHTLVRDGKHIREPFELTAGIKVFRDESHKLGWTVIESLCAVASPGGLTDHEVYTSFRDEVLDDLKKTMPVDIVLLGLHGAMVSTGRDDCEGDLLNRVRQIVGPDVPVGVELDLHCHITDAMTKNATSIVIFKEYPHTDYADRAKDLFSIIIDTYYKKIEPVISVYDCKMIGLYPTIDKPMRGFVDEIGQLEGKDNVLSISIAHGFPWGDVPDMGTKILVTTDNRKNYGDQLAETLGSRLFSLKDKLSPTFYSARKGIEKALDLKLLPIVLADATDNTGIGAPGNSTIILKELLSKGVQNAAIACIWDPDSVKIAMNVGVGAKVNLKIGKEDNFSSKNQLDLLVTVKNIVLDAKQIFGPQDSQMSLPMGDAVLIHCRGIDIVLNSVRTQTYSPACFSVMGIDPQSKTILVVKSTFHFFAEFKSLAAETLYIATPGVTNPNFKNLTYKKADLNKWPFGENKK